MLCAVLPWSLLFMDLLFKSGIFWFIVLVIFLYGWEFILGWSENIASNFQARSFVHHRDYLLIVLLNFYNDCLPFYGSKFLSTSLHSGKCSLWALKWNWYKKKKDWCKRVASSSLESSLREKFVPFTCKAQTGVAGGTYIWRWNSDYSLLLQFRFQIKWGLVRRCFSSFKKIN